MIESDNIDSEQNINTDSVPVENPPLITEKPSNEASIENINDNNQKGNAVNKDGVIGKKGTIELSPDCVLGPDAAPSELLKDIVNINPSVILDPLLTVRKSCFKKLSPENILKWQRSEISEPLLRMERIVLFLIVERKEKL